MFPLRMPLLLLALLALAQAPRAPRTIMVDERLAADAGLRLGDRVVLSSEPAGCAAPALCDTVVVGALARRRADPSEIARGEYRVHLHLDQLQRLAGYGDRVDRFAVATHAESRGPSAKRRAQSTVDAINRVAFGFRAHRSRDIAVETSKTFLVVSRFHRAIGVITIVASAIFLLCIMLLKIDERRRDVAALRLMGISARSIVRGVVLEAALVAGLGSLLGVLLGWAMAWLVNWHYQGVYRTPLAFAVVSPDIVGFAVALSLVLGVVAGWIASLRLVRQRPLELLTGRRERNPRLSALGPRPSATALAESRGPRAEGHR